MSYFKFCYLNINNVFLTVDCIITAILFRIESNLSIYLYLQYFIYTRNSK